MPLQNFTVFCEGIYAWVSADVFLTGLDAWL